MHKGRKEKGEKKKIGTWVSGKGKGNKKGIAKGRKKVKEVNEGKRKRRKGE